MPWYLIAAVMFFAAAALLGVAAVQMTRRIRPTAPRPVPSLQGVGPCRYCPAPATGKVNYVDGRAVLSGGILTCDKHIHYAVAQARG